MQTGDNATECEDSSAVEERAASIVAHEQRNLLVLVWYQIVLRVAWIFKTESIIMPAFLDYVGGSPWLRGCLPVVNRFGQSFPPLLYSRRMKLLPLKRHALMRSTIGMALPFLLLSLVWFATDGATGGWMPWLFMLVYGVFFIVTGLNQLALSTLQGKLIKPARRGRLMSAGTLIGAPLAIIAAYLLLGPWLELPDHGFGYIFGFCGLTFLLGCVAILFLVEPRDSYQEAASSPLAHFSVAWRTLRADRNFRQLNLVALLFSMVLMLFPHYQALGQQRLGLPLTDMMWWVIVQNTGTALFSAWAGPLADARGTRLVLRGAIGACVLTPLLAVYLANLHPELGQQYFWLVFLPMGLTPVAIKTLTNYTLEIAPLAEHPRYVSTVQLSFSLPILVFSPLVGLAIEYTSFETVFLAGAVLILGSGALTFGLSEPRHHLPSEMPLPEED